MSKRLLLLSLSVLPLTTIWAQEGIAQRAIPRSIFEALESDVPGEGRVTVDQSDELRQLVGSVSGRYSRVLGREGNISLMMGYRIQFFNGNLPSSKAEAYAREAMIKALATEHTCYVVFKAPFWKLVVGDFTSMAEARQVRNKLVEQLPVWGKESYVVRDKVRVLNYTPASEY
ncbi:MAG: SPOR domain-containing protein [Porphyromonadaceae bacterium]|nr:SPOR domain-containing protein [Porphyromonadaceae bacterium]